MKTLKEILESSEEYVKFQTYEKSPMQRRREMGKRMKLLAKEIFQKTQEEKLQSLLRKRENCKLFLMQICTKQAKMKVIKKTVR